MQVLTRTAQVSMQTTATIMAATTAIITMPTSPTRATTNHQNLIKTEDCQIIVQNGQTEPEVVEIYYEVRFVHKAKHLIH